ncbi:MAG: hypothetical protein JNN00_06640 [Chitinophagaceae bacterium]|nr:hypothetical protein [Chitinophagaceae bacterium]
MTFLALFYIILPCLAVSWFLFRNNTQDQLYDTRESRLQKLDIRESTSERSEIKKYIDHLNKELTYRPDTAADLIRKPGLNLIGIHPGKTITGLLQSPVHESVFIPDNSNSCSADFLAQTEQTNSSTHDNNVKGTTDNNSSGLVINYLNQIPAIRNESNSGNLFFPLTSELNQAILYQLVAAEEKSDPKGLYTYKLDNRVIESGSIKELAAKVNTESYLPAPKNLYRYKYYTEIYPGKAEKEYYPVSSSKNGKNKERDYQPISLGTNGYPDYYRITGDRYKNLYTQDILSIPENSYLNREKTSASYISFSPGAYEKFIKELNDLKSIIALRSLFTNKLYLEKFRNDTLTIIYDSAVAGNGIRPAFDQPPAKDYSFITSGYFDTLVIVDEFLAKEDRCSHGEKVMDVVRQVLNRHNLSNILPHVKIYPINYYSNCEVGDTIYKNWLAKYDSGRFDEIITSASGFSVVDSTTKFRFKNRNDKTPSTYLTTLYQTIIDASPDIITGSYVINASDPYIQYSLTNNLKTSFVNSALNDSAEIEVYMRNRLRKINAPYKVIEPLTSYLNAFEDLGIIIVGNLAYGSSFKGMFSSTGSYINSLGRGTFWGEKGITKCIQYTDNGTSYATPEIAANLFIAKAFWRSKNLEINSLEARNRLILSSDLIPSLVGKFASAGSLNMDKLLTDANAYLVTKNDSILLIDSIYKAVVFTDTHNPPRMEMSASRNSFLRSIYYIDNRFYGYENSPIGLWKQIEAPSDFILNIKFRGSDKLSAIYLSDFTAHYKQFVILN